MIIIVKKKNFTEEKKTNVGELAKMVIRFTLRPVGVYHFYCRYIFFTAYAETRTARTRPYKEPDNVYTAGHTTGLRKFTNGSLSSALLRYRPPAELTLTRFTCKCVFIKSITDRRTFPLPERPKSDVFMTARYRTLRYTPQRFSVACPICAVQ